MSDTNQSEPDIQRVGEIELDENAEFQKREWLVQRVGWAVMGLIVLAALLGLFGRGPLARAVVGGEGDPLRVEYDRFTRHASPTTLKIRLTPGVADEDGTIRLWLDREYMQAVQVEEISPEPESMEAGEDGIVYVFRVADAERSTRVTFRIQPSGYGLLSGGVGLVGQFRLRFRQFVFP